MALGVLNNLSAIYAENNLNNTSNSLQTVLQQLSSGSRINSGADDSAGLSLVNGLQANSTALTQSATNAQEGIGLLKVADGALSQVTNLLNRAITLATEASNGTLNGSQSAAANQEYQSILAEINNIGSTTTYNQQTVFGGGTIAIYTGDSSTTGSSIDNLSIRSLSSSNVGSTGGVISYSNGANNVFIDLSKGGTNAAVTDSFNGTSTTMNVNYLTKGTNGSAFSAKAAITVGAGTSFANTAQGLISAINSSGLGLNATFATATQAGAAAVATATASANGGGSGSDTGIEISGVGIGANGTGANGEGVVGSLKALAAGDTLGGTLSIVGSDGASHNITLGKANSTDNLANLASTINSGGYGVTATVTSGGALQFTSASSNVSVTATNLTESTVAMTKPAIQVAGSVVGTITVADPADVLGGSLDITQGLLATPGAAVNLALGTVGNTDTLAHLKATINTNTGTTGISASINTVDIGIAGQAGYHAANTVLTMTKAVGDLGTPTVTTTGITTGALVNNVAITVPANGALGSLTVADAADKVSGTINITNALAVPVAANQVLVAQTLTQIMNTINAVATDGINAVLSTDGKTLTFYQAGVVATVPTISAVALTDTTAAGTATLAASGSGTASLGALTVGAKTDTLTGTFNITKKDGSSTPLSLDNKTLAEMAATINGDSTYGITATLDNAGTTLSFTATAAGATNPAIANIGDISVTRPAVATTIKLANSPTIGVSNSTELGTLAMSGTLSGTISFGSNIITIGASDNTGATLASAINAGSYGVTASYSSGIMTFTSANSAMKVDTSGLSSTVNGTTTLVGIVAGSPVTSSSYYSIGISGAFGDSTTGGGTLNTGISSNSDGKGGIATTSYSDAAGENLSVTDLSAHANAQIALTALNRAITAVAALDGYIGGQINMLGSVTSVLTTQQQNVIAAQNAIQATDYASATSNMSKYEILSQTGIAALAQANSVQKEVVKLLQ